MSKYGVIGCYDIDILIECNDIDVEILRWISRDRYA